MISGCLSVMNFWRVVPFCTPTFAFQLIDAGEFTLLADEQRRVFIVRGREQHLLFTLRGDIHPGHYRVETAELQAGDRRLSKA